MVFSTVESSITKSGQALGIFKKDWHDVIYDIQNTSGIANKIKAAFSTTISSTDLDAIKKYNTEIKNGITPQTAFNRCMLNTSSAAQNLVASANGATVSEETLTVTTKRLTLAQKASAVASKAAVVALNMLGNIAIMAGINLIITGITKLVNRQKELAEQAKESAEKVNEQVKSLEELKKKYEEICNSTDDEKTKNEQLNEIKQELIEKYGFEEEAIDKINTKREKGLRLLEEEIRLNNKKSRGEWLGNNAEAIEKAENAIETSYVGKKDGIISVDDFLNGGKINLDNISKSILDMFKSVKHYEYGVDDVAFLDQHTAFDVGGDDIIEKYENIQDIISALGNKTDRTDEEEQLLKLLNEESDAMEKILDKYQDTYETAKKLKAENLFDDYIDDNPIAEVNGKDAYLAWKDGLLKTAKGDKYIEQNLIDLIEEQFPDYTEYFDNLAKAREQFGVTAPNSQYEAQKRAFIDSLSSEDLEAALNIPDLFADGLDGATAKIEAWKADPKNKITADVEVDDGDLSTMLETASNKVKLITVAMEEMNDTGYISSSTYAEIVEMGGNFADCLEVQNGKLKLNVQKLKELERQEILNAIAAKNLAISELNVAAAMAGQSHNAEKVEEIRKQITALEEERAVLWQINDEIANAKPNESGSGSSSSSADPWKEQFDKEYSKKQHLLAMEQLSEEDYLDWLDSAYKKYFSDLTKYQDEYYKYEEEVYKGRKQLAEDFYDEQQKLFEDRVSNLENDIEIATKYSTDSDGNKLDIEEKYDYISSAYQEIINEINARIGEILDAGIEGHEEEVANLEKQITEYQEKLSDVFKSAVEEEQDYIEKQKDAYSDLYDENIDKIKEQQKAAEEAAQAEIDAVQEKIDALKQANEKAEEANEIEKARQELANASQRTRQVYGADGSISFKVDQDKVKEAQEKLDKLLQEQQINILEEQKQALEDAKDKASESYDKIIENLETEKENGEKRFDILLDVLDRYLNPDNGESNSDVWKTLAHIEGAKYEDGTWKDKDGNVIDIDKLLETAETDKTEDKQTDTDNKDKDNPKDDTVISGTLTRQDIGDEEPDVKDKTESAIETFFSNLEKKFNMPSGSINLENAMQVFRNSPMMNFNPYGAMNDRTGLANKEYVNNVNNQQNITPTFTGDIVINNPVGNSDDLAKELIMNLPNAFQKQMYTNLKR